MGFQWAATMVTTRSVRTQGIKIGAELQDCSWFHSGLNGTQNKWSAEIGLVPYFDFINHSSEGVNADWDFDVETGEIWVDSSELIRVFERKQADLHRLRSGQP